MMNRHVREYSLAAMGLVLGCSTSSSEGLRDAGSPQAPSSVEQSHPQKSSAGGGAARIIDTRATGGSLLASNRSADGQLPTTTGGTNDGADGDVGTNDGADGDVGDFDGASPSADESTGGAGSLGETWDPPLPDDKSSDPPGPDGSTYDPPIGDTGDPPVGTTGDPPIGETGDPPPGETGDPPPGDTGDPPEGCLLTEVDRINVIVFGDATPTGADVEGKMWVGGNATFQGYGVAANDVGAAGNCSEYTLVVGGDLAGQVNAGAGMVAVYGKNLATNLTARCGVTKDHPVDFSALEASLKGYSTAFRNYPANGTAASVYGGLTLTGTSKQLNVFSITAAQLRSTSIKIAVPEGSSVIVNVSGKDVYFGGLGFFLPSGAACRGGNSDWCHRILWNFFEATSLQLQGIGVQGSVMAPYAQVSGTGGNVDGQLIAAELTGGIEYHPYYFSGCLLLPEKP